METIIGVGFPIPSTEDEYLRFDSKGSLSDADIVIFNSNLSSTKYRLDSPNSSFQGKSCYDDNSSFEIKEHANHWQNEVSNALKAGKIIIITLTEKIDFYLHTGQKNTSGTGRNQKVTNIVDSYHNYKFLPNLGFNVVSSKGSKIYSYSNLVTNLYECCKDFFEFQAYIESNNEIKNPLFATKKKDKILGAHLQHLRWTFTFYPCD